MKVPNEDVVNYKVFACPQCKYDRGIRDDTHDEEWVRCASCHYVTEFYNWKNQEEDVVNHPSHYASHYPVEVKYIIDLVLDNVVGLSSYQAYCLGNELKYRLRAGFKNPDRIEEDIKKAIFYNEERKNG